jgi:hypothetical protein
MGVDSPVSLHDFPGRERTSYGIELICFRRSTSTYGLIDGGRAGMIYVYLASFVGFFASVISMAEISSMYVLAMSLFDRELHRS